MLFIELCFFKQKTAYELRISDWSSDVCSSDLLIATNWLVYIYAIVSDHVLAASPGYYLTPLVNVMLGMLILGERLSRLQLLAVATAAAGVALLLADALDTLWISLMLAFSFGFSGLLRKLAPVRALPGLAAEKTTA